MSGIISCILTHVRVVSILPPQELSMYPPPFFVFSLDIWFLHLVFAIWFLIVGHWSLPRMSHSFMCFFFFLFFFLHTPLCFNYFLLSTSILLILSLSHLPYCWFLPELLISVIALINTAWLFFISSRSVVNMFISSQFGPPVYLLVTPLSFEDFGHLYSHYSEFFSGRLPISSSFVCFGGVL